MMLPPNPNNHIVLNTVLYNGIVGMYVQLWDFFYPFARTTHSTISYMSILYSDYVVRFNLHRL